MAGSAWEGQVGERKLLPCAPRRRRVDQSLEEKSPLRLRISSGLAWAARRMDGLVT